MIPGLATPAATARHATARPAAAGHWRLARGLTVSSLGMGTYLGRTDAPSRAGYQESALEYLTGGNVLDTAANYRDQASERDLGAALRSFVDSGGDRAGVVVASKAGFLHGDCDEADSDAWFDATYLGDPPALRKGDVLEGHSLAPAYVRAELGRSRRNLGLEALDLHFLHNAEHPLECGVDEEAFYSRVEDAFVVLEEECDAGRLGMYGVATWNGLRASPGTQGHLQLVKIVHHAGQARMRVGGRAGSHHFGAIELPVNVAMPEAATRASQPWRDGTCTVLQCAQELDLVTLASASLMQMRLGPRLPSRVRAVGGGDEAAGLLQVTRSLPGVSCALVGMGSRDHAHSNVSFAMATPTDAKAAMESVGLVG